MHKLYHLIMIILITIIGSNYLPAQSEYTSTLVYGPSKLLKHSKKSTFSTPEYTYLCQASITKQTNGTQLWHRYWNHPVVGLHAIYLNFGDDRVLGSASGALYSIRFKVAGQKKFNFGLQLGAGLSYLTKPYNKITNPLNNAIGSHWNNITQLTLQTETLLAKKWYLMYGLHFTHFSNARTSTPNSGINTSGMTLGLGYKFMDHQPHKKAVKDTLSGFRRLGGDMLIGYGVSEYSFTGGSKYGSYFVNAGMTYAFSPFVKAILGGEYEYNQSIFQFYYQDFETAHNARMKATKTAVYLAANLNFGMAALRLQTGYYLPLPALREETSPFYFKININIYPCPKEWKAQPYVGILLKTHVAVAQYMGLVSGVSF